MVAAAVVAAAAWPALDAVLTAGLTGDGRSGVGLLPVTVAVGAVVRSTRALAVLVGVEAAGWLLVQGLRDDLQRPLLGAREPGADPGADRRRGGRAPGGRATAGQRPGLAAGARARARARAGRRRGAAAALPRRVRRQPRRRGPGRRAWATSWR
nr:hypothetical protein [Angustibacter aerolatus]